MSDVFYTEDGAYHQASLFQGNREIVNLSVDKLFTPDGEPAGWDWMIWGAQGTWREPKTSWYGAEPSLERAKSAALEAAVVLADELAQTLPAAAKVRELSLAG